ncbi:hypothetical protein PV367_01720 [Streptomyces europaeiscabiei]|uniref:Uncharacterized protein n=1 Tax=Streptomyces europaeiscabiei TaxID=146819 RepID=A0AAJ2UHV4_9ACTN|nr:hypothetical protein [Streptomyces europaeiscabiei]MDX3128548.1 hypothetical protein [Streptomyces europaeiscabiei]
MPCRTQTGPDPVFLSILKAGREAFTVLHPHITADADVAQILRRVLMKPETEHHVEDLHGDQKVRLRS